MVKSLHKIIDRPAKTDYCNVQWITRLLRHRLIERNFIPLPYILSLREQTRLRKKWVDNYREEANRLYTRVLNCQVTHGDF